MFDIITDSACDLTLDTAKQLGIEVVPFYVSLDGEHYRKEGLEIPVRDFYQFMVDNPAAYPKTSLASIEDFEKINEELAKFSPVLAERPQIVVGNKCDLATEEQIESFRSYVEGKGLTFVPISAATMQGVRELPGLVYNRLKDIPPVPVFTPEYKKPEPKANDRAFTIKRMEAHVWSVDAPWLEYILAGSNVDDYESLQFFQRQLGESGILDALVQKGVEENDTILIGDYQFDYIF